MCVLGGCNETVHVLLLAVWVCSLCDCNETVHVLVLAVCSFLLEVADLEEVPMVVRAIYFVVFLL